MEERYSAFPSLELDRPAAHVLRLTLRAPGKLNAVSGTIHRELAAVWRAIGDDDETRAVVVRGADGAFSAGGDLDLVLEIATDYETRRRVFHEARDLVMNVIECPKPIVSAMTGPAVGAGLAVGLLADISIATPTAKIAHFWLAAWWRLKSWNESQQRPPPSSVCALALGWCSA